MLDVIFPLPIENVGLAPESLAALERCTDVPFRVIAVVDGGTRSDMVELESALKAGTFEWALMHNASYRYFNGCVEDAIPHLRNNYVAVVTPEAKLADPKWFGKMQQICMKDRLCGVIDTDSGAPSSTAYPVKRDVRRLPDPKCRLAMLTQTFLRGVGVPVGDHPLVRWWAQRAHEVGSSAWFAPGVSYLLYEHKEHPSWRASSEDQDPSESPSQMIQD